MEIPGVDDDHSHTIQKDGKKYTWYVKRLAKRVGFEPKILKI